MRWIFKVIVLVIGFVTLVSFVVMWLWNWLLPDIFGLPEINFWKAAGLLILSKILFGFKFGQKGNISGGKWKPYMAQRWQHTTPEEKEKWKAKFAEKWGCKNVEQEDQEVFKA